MADVGKPMEDSVDPAALAARILEGEADRQAVATGEAVAVRDADAAPPVVEVRGLDFSYGSVQVLFSVDLDVRRGGVLALLGTNGAGKSTLLRCISGLEAPNGGVMRLNGRDITRLSPEARVGQGVVMMPGGDALWEPLSVAENLRLGAFVLRKDPKERQRRLDRVMDLYPEVDALLEQRAGTLSGGQKQMVALAKAMLLEPEILLIDELSLGLSPIAAHQILAKVEQLRSEGLTIVIVEQSVNVALSVADRAVFIEKGHVHFDGLADDLLERDDLLRAVFLGGATDASEADA